MFVYKKKYFLIIENIKDIDLKNIKIFEKFIIIYRNQSKLINIEKLSIFRNNCKAKRIDFYVANDFKLMSILKADGLYISAYNTNLRVCRYRYSKYKIIGSAHNYKELKIKNIQGCSPIIFSRLLTSFFTIYLSIIPLADSLSLSILVFFLSVLITNFLLSAVL